MRAREEIGIQAFVDAAIECYKFAFDSGIDMDLINIAGPPDNIDRRKFQLHTAPNRASTGIRYARLFKQLQSFLHIRAALGVRKRRGNGQAWCSGLR